MKINHTITSSNKRTNNYKNKFFFFKPKICITDKNIYTKKLPEVTWELCAVSTLADESKQLPIWGILKINK